MNRRHTSLLLALVRPYRPRVALLVVLSLASALFDGLSVALVIPLLASLQGAETIAGLPAAVRPLFQSLATLPLEWAVLVLLGILLLALLVKNLFFALSIALGHWLTGRLAADLRRQAIRLLLTVDYAYIGQRHSGDHLDNIMSNTFKVEILSKALIELFVNAVMVAVLILLMLTLSWQYTVVTSASLLILGLAFSPYIRRLAAAGREQAAVRARLAALLAETFQGNVVVRTLAQENRQQMRLATFIEEARRKLQSKQTRTYLVGTITEVMGLVVIIALFLYAIATGRLGSAAGVTQLLAFVVILVRIMPAIKEVNRARGLIAANYPYLGRVAALLSEDDKPFMRDGHRDYYPLQSGIALDWLTFSYPGGDRPSLQDVTLQIPSRRVTAVVGESGAGKTTLVQLLLRLYEPDGGAILLDDVPLREFRLASLRRAIGVVSQDTFLFDDTVFNNIAFGATEAVRETEVIAAARHAGAHRFISALPDGYETRLGERGHRLSGGQRQRIAIARAFLRDPDILILDEATSALDTPAENAVRETIRQLSRDRTVIVIAHRLSTIDDADQIVVLKEGRVVEIGDREHLLRRPEGEFRRLAAGDAA